MSEEIVRINHIRKEYNADKSDNLTVLKDISLTINSGEVVVVVGPSGCGKSTLLRCINGLEPIQGGTITLRDKIVDGKSKNIALLRQKIGMVFQSYELFPHKTILQNVTLAPLKVQKRNKAEVEAEALELLDRVGLLDKKNKYQDNYREDRSRGLQL